MRRPVAYGIDFGTTNSSIAIAYDDYAEIVQHGREQREMVPSVVYIDRSRLRLIGDDAVRQYLVNPDAESARLMWSVKYFLADDIWQGTESPEGGFLEPSDIVAIVFGELKRRADAQCGHDVRRVVLGHPVLFAGAEGSRAGQLNELARSRLTEAAFRAGFEEVALLEESQAALVGEERDAGIMASLDFGGGTFDISLIETDADGNQVLIASEGAVVGGDILTEQLFDSLLAIQLGYYTELPRGYYGAHMLPEFRSLPGAVGIVGNAQARRLLQHFIENEDKYPELAVLGEVVLGGQAYPLHRAVDDLKIALSRSRQKSLSFRRPGIEIEAAATREDFELLIRDQIDLVDDAIGRALQRAGLEADDVDLVVRTGGSSQLPAFVERVNRRFGRGKVEQRDAFVTVALGLALEALETPW